MNNSIRYLYQKTGTMATAYLDLQKELKESNDKNEKLLEDLNKNKEEYEIRITNLNKELDTLDIEAQSSIIKMTNEIKTQKNSYESNINNLKSTISELEIKLKSPRRIASRLALALSESEAILSEKSSYPFSTPGDTPIENKYKLKLDTTIQTFSGRPHENIINWLFQVNGILDMSELGPKPRNSRIKLPKRYSTARIHARRTSKRQNDVGPIRVLSKKAIHS
jgi:hypothetical protein